MNQEMLSMEQLGDFGVAVASVIITTNVLSQLFKLRAKFVGFFISFVIVFGFWLNSSEFNITGFIIAVLNTMMVYSSALGTTGLVPDENQVVSNASINNESNNSPEELVYNQSTKGWKRFIFRW